MFVDDNAGTPDELIEGAASTTIRRQLPDDTGFRVVKVSYTPAALQALQARLGWRIRVAPLVGLFF